jgi:hypothetical protein
MSDGPSIAALVVPWGLEEARKRLARMLAGRGFSPRAKPLPLGYRPLPTEWLGVSYVALPARLSGREGRANTAIVTTDIGRIFHFALIVSATHPGEVLVAWRRFSGFEACAKVLWDGRPRWKDGEDPDHEGDFFIPTAPPSDLRPPSEPCVPLTCAELTAILGPRIVPLREPLAVGGESWIHRSSPIA